MVGELTGYEELINQAAKKVVESMHVESDKTPKSWDASTGSIPKRNYQRLTICELPNNKFMMLQHTSSTQDVDNIKGLSLITEIECQLYGGTKNGKDHPKYPVYVRVSATQHDATLGDTATETVALSFANNGKKKASSGTMEYENDDSRITFTYGILTYQFDIPAAEDLVNRVAHNQEALIVDVSITKSNQEL